MTTDDLYELAEENGIEVVQCELPDTHSMSVDIGGKCYIGIDCKIRGMEETVDLAHELAHCEYAGFYTEITPLMLRSKIERSARKWTYIKLLPYWKLRDLYEHGHTEAWDIAEECNLPQGFVQSAMVYYADVIGA